MTSENLSAREKRIWAVLFKTNNYSLNSFIEFRKCSHFRKENLFLSIALNVYLIYMNKDGHSTGSKPASEYFATRPVRAFW